MMAQLYFEKENFAFEMCKYVKVLLLEMRDAQIMRHVELFHPCIKSPCWGH